MRGVTRWSKTHRDSSCPRSLPDFIQDEEAPKKLLQRAVEDPVHTMQPMQPMSGPNWGQAPIVYSPVAGQPSTRSLNKGNFQANDSPALVQRDLYRFYNRVVHTMQDKVGDADHAPISGNIYRYLAFRDFGIATGLFQIKKDEKHDTHFTKGIKLVIVVQIIAPLALLFWTVHETLNSTKYGGMRACFLSGHPCMFDEVKAVALSYRILEIIIGSLFIGVFCLNSLYIIETDTSESKKIVHMSKIFSSVARYQPESGPVIPEPNVRYLYYGAIVNSLCLTTCGMAMVFAFYVSGDGIKDFVFDALGLLFLSNLDDQDGDLRFISDKWDAGFFGDIYGNLADETDLMGELRRQREDTFTPDNIYNVGFYVARFQLYVLPFLFIVMELFSFESAPS